MDMQDREFDDLFRSKLEGFEAEPTERVWPGIDTELNNEKRRRIFVPLLRIAACVIILLTAGVFFILHKEEIKPVKPHKNNVAQNPVPIIKKQDKIAPIKQVEPIQKAEYQLANEKIAKTTVHKKAYQPDVINTAPGIKETQKPVKPTVPQQEVIANVVTPVETNKITEPEVKAQSVVNNDPVTITSAQVKPQIIAQAPADQPAKQVKKHGIHNLGDLVNVVVAKVDKRKEKVLHFSDSDDDDGYNLTAVNIGPIKVNREDKDRGER